MVLTIDIGNTATKVALIHAKEVALAKRLEGQSVLQSLRTIIAEQHNSIEGIAISSTVGYSSELKEALKDCNALFLDWKTPVPIENLYSTPHTLGPDRLAAVIGAVQLAPAKNVMVIDAGTAITYDYANEQKQYLGGNISPGVQMRLKALHDYTAKLPLVLQEGETPIIGSSTETAIRAGVMNGVRLEIEGAIREYLSKNANVSVFFTGGDTINFEDSIKRCIFAQKFLVHIGLEAVFMHNRDLAKV